jgi:hypothetical protein
MSSHINSENKTFNRKFSKLAKIFSHVNVLEVDNNRQLFTVQGLHLNGLGKELLSSNLLHIYSALKEETGSLITLAWQDSNSQINFIFDNSVSNSCLDKENLSNYTANGN